MFVVWLYFSGWEWRRAWEEERRVWGLLDSGRPYVKSGSPTRSLLADWHSAHRLFVCVHGKWGGVAAVTALGLSISVMGVGGGVWYVSPPRLMDRKYNQRNNNICRIYIQKNVRVHPYFSYGFSKTLSTGLNPDWWACLFKRCSLYGGALANLIYSPVLLEQTYGACMYMVYS